MTHLLQHSLVDSKNHLLHSKVVGCAIWLDRRWNKIFFHRILISVTGQHMNNSAMFCMIIDWEGTEDIGVKCKELTGKVLSDISNFPVTQNIIQDPMHCLLEGVCGQEIAMFLNRIICDLGIVSLNWFNDKLKNF